MVPGLFLFKTLKNVVDIEFCVIFFQNDVSCVMEAEDDPRPCEILFVGSENQLTRQTSRTSASPEPPPEYDEACNAFLLNEIREVDSFENEGNNSDIATLGEYK